MALTAFLRRAGWKAFPFEFLFYIGAHRLVTVVFHAAFHWEFNSSQDFLWAALMTVMTALFFKYKSKTPLQEEEKHVLEQAAEIERRARLAQTGPTVDSEFPL